MQDITCRITYCQRTIALTYNFYRYGRQTGIAPAFGATGPEEEASKDSSRVFLTAHARARMRQRRISIIQVLRCLRHGKISEGPAPDVMKGGWKCTVEHYTAGEQIGVSVGIETTETST